MHGDKLIFQTSSISSSQNDLGLTSYVDPDNTTDPESSRRKVVASVNVPKPLKLNLTMDKSSRRKLDRRAIGSDEVDTNNQNFLNVDSASNMNEFKQVDDYVL